MKRLSMQIQFKSYIYTIFQKGKLKSSEVISTTAIYKAIANKKKDLDTNQDLRKNFKTR